MTRVCKKKVSGATAPHQIRTGEWKWDSWHRPVGEWNTDLLYALANASETSPASLARNVRRLVGLLGDSLID